MSEPTALELLGRATRLYREAKLDGDACRCLERAGDFAAAGWLHRDGHRFAEAAACFERGGQWLPAAQAHETARTFDDAARCYQAAGQPLTAAWLLAHHLGRPERALALVAALPVDDPSTELGRALVRARCRAATRPRDAAREIRRVVTALATGTLSASAQGGVIARALALAETINRPDLSAALFAVHPGAVSDWAVWASERLGSADGVPAPDPFDDRDQHEESAAR